MWTTNYNMVLFWLENLTKSEQIVRKSVIKSVNVTLDVILSNNRERRHLFWSPQM